MMNSSCLRTTLLFGALAIAACGGARESGAGATESTNPERLNLDRLTGQILITGTAQIEFVTLQIDGGGAVNLSGVLLPELRRLSGAMVSVEGSRTDAAPLQRLEATAYEVTSIDGQRPAVGILRELDGSVVVAGTETVRLSGVPDALRRQMGAKVWVVGRDTDSGLQVQSYGVILEP